MTNIRKRLLLNTLTIHVLNICNIFALEFIISAVPFQFSTEVVIKQAISISGTESDNVFTTLKTSVFFFNFS